MSSNILRRIFGGPGVTHRDVPENLVPAVVGLVPEDLLTNNSGANRRLRVDVGQTGFFDRREFRTYREFNSLTTTTYVIKIVIPINIIVFRFGAEIDNGFLRMASMVGGSEVGTFGEELPLLSRNTMTETDPYTPQLSITAGGTHNGGTETDVIRLKTDANSNRAFSIEGGGAGDERGIAPTTIYLVAQMTDFTGIIRGWWEERP